MNPISDLYTTVMENIMPFLLANWQLFLMFVGALFLAGAVFRWRWVCDPQGTNVLGFHAFAYRMFGEMGYRVVIGATGLLIIICGIVLWLLT